MNAFWQSIKMFFSNLGHTVMADIVDALPQVQQEILSTVKALIEAAILYVETKYGSQVSAMKDVEPMTAEQKLVFDSQRHNDAFNYIKSEMSANPSAYVSVPDSLLHCGIEIYVQKSKRNSEGNGGNFPGGNSNA